MKKSVIAKHYVVPDTQVRPGVPTEHLKWIGKDILDRRPTVIIHLGDHWDMSSLSSWDKGKKQFEGRRYQADIKAGNEAFKLLTEPTRRWNAAHPRNKYTPRWVFCLGNHEDRITRTIEETAMLDGAIGLEDLDTEGWEVVPFLKPIVIDGVTYCHYFYNPMTGRPYGGQAIARLKTIGHSFTMGHQQTLDYALRFVGDRSQHALIAGACYLHDEEYKGPQGNAHWRGVIVKHDVRDGSYNPMFLDLEYLCRRYGSGDLSKYVR